MTIKRTAGQLGLAPRACICDPMDLAALGHMLNCPCRDRPAATAPAPRADHLVNCRCRQVTRGPDGRVATVAWKNVKVRGRWAAQGSLLRLADGVWEVRQVGVAA